MPQRLWGPQKGLGVVLLAQILNERILFESWLERGNIHERSMCSAWRFWHVKPLVAIILAGRKWVVGWSMLSIYDSQFGESILPIRVISVWQSCRNPMNSKWQCILVGVGWPWRDAYFVRDDT